MVLKWPCSQKDCHGLPHITDEETEPSDPAEAKRWRHEAAQGPRLGLRELLPSQIHSQALSPNRLHEGGRARGVQPGASSWGLAVARPWPRASSSAKLRGLLAGKGPGHHRGCARWGDHRHTRVLRPCGDRGVASHVCLPPSHRLLGRLSTAKCPRCPTFRNYTRGAGEGAGRSGS